MKITDEAHLLRLYYEAARRVVFETSGSFERDISRLNARVIEYAADHGLEYPDYVEGV